METIILDDFLEGGIIRERSFRQQVRELDLDQFQDKKVIIKGCASVTVPTWAYLIIHCSTCTGRKKDILW